MLWFLVLMLTIIGGCSCDRDDEPLGSGPDLRPCTKEDYAIHGRGPCWVEGRVYPGTH